MRALTVIAALLASLAGGCTLLLPTDELIKACVVDEDCDKGFECKENACLPIDEVAAAEGEGEGEGE